MRSVAYVRFQSAVPNAGGRFPGVFAMTNGLRDAGLLSEADRRWVTDANARSERAHTDPGTVDPDCFSREINPGARSWFKADARALIAMMREYTALLDRYGVPWTELRTSTPGRIVYEDDVQVVAVPYAHEEHWPFSA